MYDYKSIPSDEAIGYKFTQTAPGVFKIYDVATSETIGALTEDNLMEVAVEEGQQIDSIRKAFKLWQTRPDSKVGKQVEIEGVPVETLINTYEELLIGAYILKYGSHTITDNPNGYARIVEWLRTTDMYTAPSSTRYHDSYPSGLLVHSLRVYNNALDLLNVPQFKTVSLPSLTLATLTHDWCKIGMYEMYMKNEKDEVTGTWNKVPAYRHNSKGLTLGHGVTSMFLASRFFNLTATEALAIRWHMGAWRCVDSEYDELQNANEVCPLVHLVQFADQLSITKYPAENVP